MMFHQYHRTGDILLFRIKTRVCHGNSIKNERKSIIIHVIVIFKHNGENGETHSLFSLVLNNMDLFISFQKVFIDRKFYTQI